MIAQNLKQHMVDCLRAAIETINSDMPDRDILIGLYAAERSLVFDRRSLMRQTGMEAGGRAAGHRSETLGQNNQGDARA